jgi:hypothetical protein
MEDKLKHFEAEMKRVHRRWRLNSPPKIRIAPATDWFQAFTSLLREGFGGVGGDMINCGSVKDASGPRKG